MRDILVNQLNTHKLVIGYNHHFGRNREGSFEHLKEFAPVYGFEVEEIPAQLLDDVGVSSTKIRKALFSGAVAQAAEFLGYHYSISAQVVHGNAFGRSLDFPTANLQPNDELKLIPQNGVYAVWVVVQDIRYKGMMNIGVKPTFKNQKKTLEVHILGFDQLIYDSEIKVEFVQKVREEIKFENASLLHQQLLFDRDEIDKILES